MSTVSRRLSAARTAAPARQSQGPVRDLTTGSPMRLILQFVAPLLFGYLFQQFYSFVDTAIVGRYLGAAKLAAVGDTSSINFLVLGMCMGVSGGFAIPVAQAFGARDEAQLRRCVAHSAYLTAGLGVLIAVATALACEPILRLMDTPEDILPDAVTYIRIIFAAIPITLLYNTASGILRSLGDSKTPVLFLVLASLVNIALDLVFILLCGMDVAGAALATVISQLVSGIGCLWVMAKRFPVLRLSREDRVFRPALARRMLGVGLPMGLQYSITAVGSVLVQWSVNGIGVSAVAAIAASGKISAFFACMFDALAATMATFAGQNMGARRLNRINSGLRAASLIGTAYCLVSLAVIWLFGSRLIGLFISAADGEVLGMAVHYLRINTLFYIPLLFVNIVRLSIQGMGFTRVAMLAGMFEMLARSLVALLVVPAFGYNGACFANPAAWVLADLFLFPCYLHVMRGLKQRVGEADSLSQ